jgi:ParB/RepB/Spo0J family partition protein
MLISLDRIFTGDVPLVRRQPISAEADAALAASIAQIGVLQPILVRPLTRSDTTWTDTPPIPVNGSNEAWEIITGHRRVAAARAAGLTEIPAEVREMTDPEAAAAQVATQTLAEALHPVDQWLAVRDMVAGGMRESAAARALGMSDRDLALMRLLSQLHPAILDLCRIQMPGEHALRVITRAPHAKQAAASEIPGIREVDDHRGSVSWWRVEDACKAGAPASIPRGWARFDLDAHPEVTWEEDLFAQPGAGDAWRTEDVKAFKTAQQAWLDAQAGPRTVVWVSKTHGNTPPAGHEIDWAGDRAKLKKGQKLGLAMAADGQVHERVLRVTRDDGKAGKTRDAKRPDAADPDSDAAEDPDDRSVGADAPDADAGMEGDGLSDRSAGAAAGITKTGLSIIAARKTEAVRATFMGGDMDAHDLLVFMVLLLGADNVSVQNWPRRDAQALAVQLLDETGSIRADLPESQIRAAARTVLANALRWVAQPGAYSTGSGPAGEWIARIAGAEANLGRFDDEEFLGAVTSAQLRKAAESGGVTYKGTAKAMRDRLKGQAERWIPDAATFGAPGPRGAA